MLIGKTSNHYSQDWGQKLASAKVHALVFGCLVKYGYFIGHTRHQKLIKARLHLFANG